MKKITAIFLASVMMLMLMAVLGRKYTAPSVDTPGVYSVISVCATEVSPESNNRVKRAPFFIFIIDAFVLLTLDVLLIATPHGRDWFACSGVKLVLFADILLKCEKKSPFRL